MPQLHLLPLFTFRLVIESIKELGGASSIVDESTITRSEDNGPPKKKFKPSDA